MPRRNILVVHGLEDLKAARRSSLDYVYAFERYAPENNYHYHQIYLPLPECVRRIPWDAVIFESTALCFVTLPSREQIERIRDQWAFLRRAPAVKIAFPQDDASHGAVLDLFLGWLHVDAVYTVLPGHIELIYPVTSRQADFFPTFAGLIDDRSIEELQAMARPFDERRWQIGQRVTMHPAWGGRLSQLKGLAALAVQEEARRRGVAENISVDESDVFFGDDWYRFLGDCRLVVGAEGGMSVWDPYGAIEASVAAYCAAHPRAAFDEIADNCFPGLDGRFSFPVITPRVFEAALMGCGQILVEGAYDGIIEASRHYIPLKADFSNLAEVFEAVGNRGRVHALIDATRRDLVDSPRYRFSTLVAEVFEYIDRQSQPAGTPSSADEFARHLSAYDAELVQLTAAAGLSEEHLEGPALRDWVRSALIGQVAEPGRIDALLERTLPPAGGLDARVAETAAATGGSPDSASPEVAAASEPPRVRAGLPWLRRAAGWGVALVVAAVTYPLAVAALGALAPPQGAGPAMAPWVSLPLAIAIVLAWAVLPRRFVLLSPQGLRAGVAAAAAWAIAAHAVWLVFEFSIGRIGVLDRRLPLLTIGMQAALALGAIFAARCVFDRRWRYWCLALAASLPVLLVAMPEATHLLPLFSRVHLALAAFAAIGLTSFEMLVVHRGADMHSPAGYAFGVVAAATATQAVWIFSLFGLDLLAAVPRWLPPANIVLGAAVAGVLPIAIDLWRGRLTAANFLSAAASGGDPATRAALRLGSQQGRRNAWLFSERRVLDDARLARLVESLVQAGWRIVVCGRDDVAAVPSAWNYVSLPQASGFRPSLRFGLSLLAAMAVGLVAIGWPRWLRRRAGLACYWCCPEALNLRRSLRDVALSHPDLLPELVIADGALAGGMAAALARWAGAKLVVDFGGGAAEPPPRDPRWAFGAYAYVEIVADLWLRRADLVTVPSAQLAARLLAERRIARPALVLRALPLKPAEPFRPAGERIKVLYQGSLWHPQQLHVAIQSMALWRPEFDLVLQGEGDPAYIAELRRLAARLGLGDRISIEPAPPASQRLAAANRADIGYLSYPQRPQLMDSAAPPKFFDYLAAGLAVCVIDLGDMAQLVRRYRLGRLIPQHSAPTIAEAVNGFTREAIDDCKRSALAAVEELDWETEKLKVLRAFDALLGAAPMDQPAASSEAVARSAA